MLSGNTIRASKQGTMRMLRGVTLLCAGLFAVTSVLPAVAQVSSYGDKASGPANDKPSVLSKVGITQRLNEQLPLALPFVDETGKTVQLGELFRQASGDSRARVLSMPHALLGRIEWFDVGVEDGTPDAR